MKSWAMDDGPGTGRAGELGPTLTHEHIFWDARGGWNPAELTDPHGGDAPFDARFGGPALEWLGVQG